MNLEARLAHSAATLDAAIDAYESSVAHGGTAHRTPSWHRLYGATAAAVVAVVGVMGLAYLRAGTGAPAGEPVTPPPAVAAPADPASGPLLTAAVPAGVVPYTTVAGWRVEGSSVPTPMTARPSAACPGCGASRLVLTSDAPAWTGGPLFTAWTVTGTVDLSGFAADTSVGAIAGRVTSSPEGTPTDAFRTTLAWPVGPDRTAFVDARGLPVDTVHQMAAALVLDGEIPTLATLPDGFRQVEAPPAGGPERTEMYLNLTDGRHVLEVVTTSGGLHGLVDWASIGNVLVWDWVPRAAGTTTVAFDAPPADERPILAASAAWVAGDWGAVVIGHMFDSEEEFLAAVASLEITDEATFAAATAGMANSPLPGVLNATGWYGVVQTEP